MLTDFGEEEEVLLNEIFYGTNNKYNTSNENEESLRVSRAEVTDLGMLLRKICCHF